VLVVVVVAPGGSVVRQWGSRGSSDGRFHAPSGIAAGAGGQVFVLDGENNRVQVFDGGGRFLARWGLREVGFVVVLGGFGIPPEAALATSVLVGLCLIIIGLPGGLLWLTGWDITGASAAKSGRVAARVNT